MPSSERPGDAGQKGTREAIACPGLPERKKTLASKLLEGSSSCPNRSNEERGGRGKVWGKSPKKKRGKIRSDVALAVK